MIGMEFRNETIGVCKLKQNSTLLPQTRLQPEDLCTCSHRLINPFHATDLF